MRRSRRDAAVRRGSSPIFAPAAGDVLSEMEPWLIPWARIGDIVPTNRNARAPSNRRS